MTTDRAVSDLRERQLRLEAELYSQLRRVKDVRKALVYGLRATREAFDAEEGAIATRKPGRRKADVVFRVPRHSRWDAEIFAEYLGLRRPAIPESLLLAPVQRRGRNWAIIALRDPDEGFKDRHRDALFSIAEILSEAIHSIDRNRTGEVRRRIQNEIADGTEPKDLMYNILHGLRSLTRYDHSASLFICEGDGALRLVAEQIAWTKARSQRIGRRLRLDEELAFGPSRGEVHIFERRGRTGPEKGWPTPLASKLGYRSGATRGVPPEVAMICAPIATPETPLGLLKVSARRPDVLGEYETELVREFIPLASLAIQFSRKAESLSQKVLLSERKHALANLTRGITHDVNNALGAMLPLVQQIRHESERGALRPEELRTDLASLEKSIQTCRRIFGAMLAIARGSSRAIGHGNVRRAVEHSLSVLEDSLKRGSIEVTTDLPEELPTIKGGQGDLTQLFLNVLSNAKDAMPSGGELRIVARHGAKSVRVQVTDTGCGIAAGARDRILEPFFTTKEDGNGLGLAICRSILWDVGGEMRIEAEEPRGTRVTLSLPVLPLDAEVDASR